MLRFGIAMNVAAVAWNLAYIAFGHPGSVPFTAFCVALNAGVAGALIVFDAMRTA